MKFPLHPLRDQPEMLQLHADVQEILDTSRVPQKDPDKRADEDGAGRTGEGEEQAEPDQAEQGEAPCRYGQVRCRTCRGPLSASEPGEVPARASDVGPPLIRIRGKPRPSGRGGIATTDLTALCALIDPTCQRKLR